MAEEKLIRLDDTVYITCEKHHEVKEIMSELGFTDILKSGMLNTVGRFMTIRKGAQMKKISLELIVSTFENHGFSVER